jgi:DNA polymerase-3 subunit beta
MKLSVNREALLAACRLAGRLLSEHPISPAEEHFLLRAGPGICSLHAAGPEATLRLPIAARVDQAGQTLLPARLALAVLRAAAVEEVSLEAGAGSVVLRWPGLRYRLESPSTTIFPPDEPVPAGRCLVLSAEKLSRAIRSTLFAAGPGHRRYRLEGVLFEAAAERLRVVATDNRRLAVDGLPALEPCQGLGQETRVLPAVAVALLARLADAAQGTVQMRLGRERAFFQVGEAILSCGYETGPYPHWRSAVPAAPPCRLEVPVAGLLDAVRQAAVLRERECARLLLSLEPGRLVLESGRIGGGRSRVGRKAPYQGKAVRVALEPRYLVELLRCLEGEAMVELGLTDADTPVMFRAGDYTHVLMPLRTE